MALALILFGDPNQFNFENPIPSNVRFFLDPVETSKPLLAFAVGLVALIGCAPDEITSDWHRIEPPVPAAEFSLEQLDGSTVNLSDYRGQVVIMEFWATWCGPCRFSLPSLEVIYKRFRDRGVSVLLINQDEPVDAIRKWAGTRFTAPILLDEGGRVGQRYGVRGIPRLFIIDEDGNLVYAHAGYGGGLERNLTLILEQLLPGASDHG
jgi:peroxiredoxin